MQPQFIPLAHGKYFMEGARQTKHHYDDLSLLNNDVEKILMTR